MRAILLATLLLSSTTSVVSADAVPFECKYDGNQQEMNTCAIRDYKTADSALKAKYEDLLRRLPVSKQQQLRLEQRAWLSKLDPECRAKANEYSEGGSMWPLEFYGCLQSETESRIKWLAKWETKR